MRHEVYIDMEHDSSLTTVALLSAYTENSSNHYLDLLTPFVEYCMPSVEGAILDYKELSDKLGAEFGIVDMPTNIVGAIVKRYAKNNPNAVVRQNGNGFAICKKVNNVDFDQRRRSIRNQIDSVATKFDGFIATHPWKRPEKSAKDLLLAFFQSYGLTVMRNVDELHLVSTQNSELFVVAKFILWAHEKDALLFDALIDLTKGFLTYRAIYQIGAGDKQDHMSKLRNTKCFLDCSLLISLLGYDTQESQTSVQSLIEMLRKNGGRIFVFDHTIDEAKYLLVSYADTQDKLRFRLPGIKAKRLSDAVVRAQALALDSTVRNYGIVQQSVSDDDVARERSNYAPLLNCLREGQGNGYRSEYDFKSIVGIKKLRNSLHPMQIENCTAILLTQDLRLAHSIRRYTLSTNHEMAFAKLDTDMIAMLWLQTFTACPNMPKDILLSNAAAAVTLSDDVRKRAIELSEMWVADGSMDPSMAQMLRSDRLDELLLANSTANNPDDLNIDTIRNVVMRALEPEIESEREKVRQQERAAYERKIIDVSRRSAQDIATAELAMENKTRTDARKRLIEQSRRIDSKAQKVAKKLRTFAQWLGIAVFVALVIALSAFQVADMYKAYISAETSVTAVPWLEWSGRVFLILLAVYGTISSFFDGKITVRRILNALERRIYDLAHSHYEQLAKDLSSDVDPIQVAHEP